MAEQRIRLDHSVDIGALVEGCAAVWHEMKCAGLHTPQRPNLTCQTLIQRLLRHVGPALTKQLGGDDHP